ncbi:TrbI/VirB10 family protein [Caenispirillum bisanense]|uniref:TrbI/VirB10 family protein n=1 Tax=Caenispirillum bisanense TaxID=414052 RepID=UPI0031E4228B
MSAVCDVALVLGLTLSGLCAPPAEPPPAAALPEDDEAAWSVPAPPAPPERPPAPAMPPVVITKVVQMPAPPPPDPPAPPPAPPPPDPYRLAAQAAWNARTAARPTFDGSMSTYRANMPQLMPASLTPGPTVAPPAVAAPAPKPDYEGDRRVSSLPVDNSRIVTTDRYIVGVLETGINSQLDGSSGSIVIQVSRDVFGYHGRNLLIPKGSRLVCDYESPDQIGASRLAVSCNRVLMAEHRAEIIELASAAGDVQGRAGFTGEVDTRFGERYGTALMLTGISTAVRLATAMASTGDKTADTLAQATDKGAEEMSTRFGEITASVLEQTIDLAPIITVPQGTRVQIRPSADWYIREVTS